MTEGYRMNQRGESDGECDGESHARYASEGSGVDRRWDDLRAGLDGLQDEDGRPRVKFRDDSQDPGGSPSDSSGHPRTGSLREGANGPGHRKTEKESSVGGVDF